MNMYDQSEDESFSVRLVIFIILALIAVLALM